MARVVIVVETETRGDTGIGTGVGTGVVTGVVTSPLAALRLGRRKVSGRKERK